VRLAASQFLRYPSGRKADRMKRMTISFTQKLLLCISRSGPEASVAALNCSLKLGCSFPIPEPLTSTTNHRLAPKGSLKEVHR
jgi:hypothetical protein